MRSEVLGAHKEVGDSRGTRTIRSVAHGDAGEADGLFVRDQVGSRGARRLTSSRLQVRRRRPHVFYRSSVTLKQDFS